MHVNLDTRDALHVARQPIFDSSERVFGYELLYRDNAKATACEDAGDMAAARVLADAVLALGLDTLTGGRPAFLNFTRRLLVNAVGVLVSPKATVLELREDIQVDAEVIDACRTLRAQGYVLALDDFVAGTDAEQLLPLVTFVKVDVLATPAEMRAALAGRLRPQALRLIAEKVETAEMAAEVQSEGYELLQGYFFCKPKTLSTRAISGQRLVYLRMLAAVNRSNVTVGELEALVKQDASMSYRVLQSVNSAGSGVRKEVQSIREAIILLGLDQIRKWASIWALAGVNLGGTRELTTVAILRARSCELLGKVLGGDATDDGCFLLGLCSVIDAIMGQPMERALAELPVAAQTRRALLGHPGLQRSILDAVIAYERGEWSEAGEALGDAGLDARLLPAAYDDALRWAQEFASLAS